MPLYCLGNLSACSVPRWGPFSFQTTVQLGLIGRPRFSATQMQCHSWSAMILSCLQICSAYKTDGGRCVVVLSNRPKVEMEVPSLPSNPSLVHLWDLDPPGFWTVIRP